ncbi:hypothetical protein K7432_002889 [Basidiobolus ranarum]|uniref:Uncharacterized protein n=1 Tax=Basidiobolus ranarum TaxID=34480 RepID=A0ABR2W731_9FUNG
MMNGERVDLSVTPNEQLTDPPLDALRYFNRCRLKSAFDSIFQKYGRDFEESDVVDISTGEVIEDKGFLKKTPQRKLGSLFKPKEEKTPFTKNMFHLLEPGNSTSTEEETLQETPNKTPLVKEVYDEEDFESILVQEKSHLSRNFPPFYSPSTMGFNPSPFLPSNLNPLFNTPTRKAIPFNNTRSIISPNSNDLPVDSPATNASPHRTELVNSHTIHNPLKSPPTNTQLELKESPQSPASNTLEPVQDFITSPLSPTPTVIRPTATLNVAPHVSTVIPTSTSTTKKRKWEDSADNEKIVSNYESMDLFEVAPQDRDFEVVVLIESKSQQFLSSFTSENQEPVTFTSTDDLSPKSYVSSMVSELVNIRRAASRANTPTFKEHLEKYEANVEESQDDDSHSIVYEYLETSRNFMDSDSIDFSKKESLEISSSREDNQKSISYQVQLLETSHTIQTQEMELVDHSFTKPTLVTETNGCKGYGKCTKAFCFDCAFVETEID